MKHACTAAIGILLAAFSVAKLSAEETSAPLVPTKVTPTTPPGLKPICLLNATGPQPDPALYAVVKKIKIKKGGYGSVDDAIADLASKARSLNANAIVGYAGSQRFGFLPWQFVRPVVTGTLVRWKSSEPVDCVAMGGSWR